jgi:hypothetical protein
MKLLKPDFSTYSAALILGSLSIGFAPAATAASTYDAFAEFSLTLNDVSTCDCAGGGSTVTDGWEVTGLGDGVPFLTEVGIATATGEIIAADTTIAIGESIYQSSSSSGIAYNGLASTDALSDLAVTISNMTSSPLTFIFDYSADMYAATTGDAIAGASIDLWDGGLGYVNITAAADAMSGPDMDDSSFSENSLAGILTITVAGGGEFIFDGFVDTFGQAQAVPVPAAVWLFGTGLIGLIAVARRKNAA